MDEQPAAETWFDTLSFPALLRAARGTYRRAISNALIEAGFDELPRGGAFVLGGMALEEAPLSTVVQGLGQSKQAVGRLIDAMVDRGYVARDLDASDGRRVKLVLTEQGTTVAATVRAAVEQVDAELSVRVGETAVHDARAALGALAMIGRHATD